MIQTLAPRVQQLESRADLRLLINGDLVNANFTGYDGVAVYREIDSRLIPGTEMLVLEVPREASFHFKYLCKDIDMLDIDVQKNKIIARSFA